MKIITITLTEYNFHKWSIARMRNILIHRLFYLKSLMGKGDENIESEVAEVKGYMCQLCSGYYDTDLIEYVRNLL